MIAQLATLKARLGITDTTDDTLLTNFLELCGGRFDLETRRTLEKVSGKQEQFNGDETELRVLCYPIVSVASIWLKSNETDSWEEQTDVDYVIRRACVVSLSSRLGTENQQILLIYTGGYVPPGTSPGAGETQMPNELEHAAVEQCAYWYQNRNRLGLIGVTGEGGSLSQYAQIDLLPNVKAVLKQYERWAN